MRQLQEVVHPGDVTEPQNLIDQTRRARTSARLTLWRLAPALILFEIDRGFKNHVMTLPERPSAGPVDFNLFRNHGIAFSLPLPNLIFWPLAIIIFIVLTRLCWREFRRSTYSFIAYTVILSGAFSNLWDRFLYGATIDYLIFFRRSAVNLADAMIVIGLIVLLFLNRPYEKDKRRVSGGDIAHR
ncbi:MAG: signal peptidase II [Patescibacteria group bacterium]